MHGAVFEEYARARGRRSEALKEGLSGLVPPDAGGVAHAPRDGRERIKGGVRHPPGARQ